MSRLLVCAALVATPLAAQVGRPAPPRVAANDNRVPAGTVIAATLTNRLGDSTVTVHGFYARPGTGADSLVLAPGQRARVTFSAGAPGTYLYHAVAGTVDTLHEREQLAGAFIVDTAGAPGDDRIFVINIWSDGRLTPGERHALAINGRSFPFTELQTLPLGGPVDWRWINASRRNHPMHMHGFYFRVDSKGREGRDTIYAPGQAWQAVTEMMLAGSTMRVRWTPNRSGNWLFHCHVGFHVVPTARMNQPPPGAHEHHSGDMREHMAGLVLPITVPAVGPPTERGEARRLRLYVQAGPPRGRVARALSFIPDRGAPPAADSVEWPGGLLVLSRDEPTDVVLLNRLPEATVVHWHGPAPSCITPTSTTTCSSEAGSTDRSSCLSRGRRAAPAPVRQHRTRQPAALRAHPGQPAGALAAAGQGWAGPSPVAGRTGPGPGGPGGRGDRRHGIRSGTGGAVPAGRGVARGAVLAAAH